MAEVISDILVLGREIALDSERSVFLAASPNNPGEFLLELTNAAHGGRRRMGITGEAIEAIYTLWQTLQAGNQPTAIDTGAPASRTIHVSAPEHLARWVPVSPQK